jgi:hypothetical protein
MDSRGAGPSFAAAVSDVIESPLSSRSRPDLIRGLSQASSSVCHAVARGARVDRRRNRAAVRAGTAVVAPAAQASGRWFQGGR